MQDIDDRAHARSSTRRDERERPAPCAQASGACTPNRSGQRGRGAEAGREARGDRNARTLVEDSDFRLVVTVLDAEAPMREHRAAGRVSLQGLQGHLRLQAREHTADLTTNRVVVLRPDLLHSVEAVEEGAFLIWIASASSPGKSD